MKITIDVPQLDGTEWEATGEFRHAKKEEPFWSDGEYVGTGPTSMARIILRRRWEWPAWLEGMAAVARDKFGNNWYAYRSVPELGGDRWLGLYPVCVGQLPAFIAPHPDSVDWKETLTINPKWEARAA